MKVWSGKILIQMSVTAQGIGLRRGAWAAYPWILIRSLSLNGVAFAFFRREAVIIDRWIWLDFDLRPETNGQKLRDILCAHDRTRHKLTVLCSRYFHPKQLGSIFVIRSLFSFESYVNVKSNGSWLAYTFRTRLWPKAGNGISKIV